MYAFTQTPLGRLLNAVRDNAERLSFLGYQPQRVRYLAFIIAGFFAGISGGMAVVHFEVVTTEVLGATRSGVYLLFTFLGGSGYFVGPILGAVGMVLSSVLLSEWTAAWQLYVGVLFLAMVMHAPGGMASLGVWHLRWMTQPGASRLWGCYVGCFVSASVAVLGLTSAIELFYHHQLQSSGGQPLQAAAVAAPATSTNLLEVMRGLAGSTTETVERGKTIFFPGDPAEKVYLLRRGAVRLSRVYESGEEITVALLRENSLFGVLSLLTT
jgi:branched-chain amino acid transport system permease protein